MQAPQQIQVDKNPSLIKPLFELICSLRHPLLLLPLFFAIFDDLLFSYRVVPGCCRIAQFLVHLKVFSSVSA